MALTMVQEDETTGSLSTSKSPRQSVRTRLIRCSGDLAKREEDELAVEEPLEIVVAQGGVAHTLAVTLRTPGREKDLALGYLYSEGIVTSYRAVRSIRVKVARGSTMSAHRVLVQLGEGVAFDLAAHQRHLPISAACGACGKSALEALKVYRTEPLPLAVELLDSSVIAGLARTLETLQAGYLSTGGLHAAARFSRSGLLEDHAEDIGRHNALDKLAGAALRSGKMDWSTSILLLSGRLGYDLMQKAIMLGCPVVVSVGAPSSLAIELACHFRITVVGFLREGRFNVYSVSERIRFVNPV